MKYDIAVIGAGIAGCAIANYAKGQGREVLIVDRAQTPATGGSGGGGGFYFAKIG